MDQVRNDGPHDQDLVIQIELWLNGSVPCGVATGPRGAPRDFTGWVGLMSAVDALAGDGESRMVEEDERRKAEESQER